MPRIDSPAIYGEPISVKGMTYAPATELGVVFLFGILCADEDFGYWVESVKGGYPDCIAMRRVKRGAARVRIEFELKSSSFQAHGHDPKKCDLIVCWEDDWPDCPIEVLELRSAIQALQK